MWHPWYFPQLLQHQCPLMLGMDSPATGNGGSRQVPGVRRPGPAEFPSQS